MRLSDLNLKSFDPLYPMRIHQYNELINDANVDIMDKVNAVIDYLNQVGKLTNDVVKDWNVVYQWVMNDGLTQDVSNKLEQMLANHEFDSLISTIVAMVGDLTTLTTSQKDTIVNAINSLKSDLTTSIGLKADQTALTATNNLIGDLTTLQTADKDTLVHAINDNTTSIIQFGNAVSGADPTGTTDSTTAFQTALDKKGMVLIPSGTYLVGGLIIRSNTQLVGLGKVTLKYITGQGYASPFGTCIIANENLPAYKTPSDNTRQTLYNLANNITIENITLDMQNSATCGGIQLVCVDYANLKDVTINNGREGLDLRAIRYSTFTRVYCDNIQQDVISVTDQNFLAPTGLVHHGISKDVLFDRCRVTNSCTLNQSGSTSMNAFEMDDGMYNFTFRDCVAENNFGCGFDLHLHTIEYDMQNISFINCKSINNTPLNGLNSTAYVNISGFEIGQCPAGSTFKNIMLENCVSIGSPVAFKNSSGAELGYKENVTVIGGYWSNAFGLDVSGNWLNGGAVSGTIDSNNSVIRIGKQFRSFKFIGLTIQGNQDSYGFYSYGTGDGVKISNVTIKGSYIPLGLTHAGGRLELSNISIDVTNPSNALSSIFISAECDDVLVNGVIAKMDASKYSSSLIRFINTKKNSVAGLVIENTGVLGGNCIQFDTVDMATLTGCNIKNFTNAVFLSNTSNSIVSAGNSFKGCTNKYNSTPTYLTDGTNAI